VSVLVYLSLLLLLPLCALLWSLVRVGAPAVRGALADPELWSSLVRSLAVAALVVAINTAFGVAGGLVLVRQRFRGRTLIDALVDVPLSISPVMTGLALLLVFGRGGWAEPALEVLGLQVTFAFPGLVLATLFVTAPLALREVGHVLAQAGTIEEDAAATLGATPWQTFREVTLPNIRHGVVLGATLTAARALGEFGAVLVVGGAILGRTQTATTLIYSAVEERREATAYSMAVALVALSALTLVLLRALRRRLQRAGRDDGHPD
jgi:sulfate transport system permease protein